MKSAFLILPAVLMLAACAQPTQVEEAEPMVTYNYEPGQLEETELRAEKYCRERYGREARLVSRSEDEGGDLVASYECSS